jgi:hypothetical protein
MSLQQFTHLPDDVVAGYQYLSDRLQISSDQLVIIGEGAACAYIEIAMRRGHIDAPVVYLSPVFDSEDRELGDAISFHPNRGALLFYSKEDLHSLKSTSYFKQKKNLEKLKIAVFDNAGHGIDILRRDPAALEALQVWLRESTGVQ